MTKKIGHPVTEATAQTHANDTAKQPIGSKRAIHCPLRIKVSEINPLIGETSGDSLHAISTAVQAIRGIHDRLADWGAISALNGMAEPPDMTPEEHQGIGYLLGCIRGALEYAIEHDQDNPMPNKFVQGVSNEEL